jgi:hypothetical protein
MFQTPAPCPSSESLNPDDEGRASIQNVGF